MTAVDGLDELARGALMAAVRLTAASDAATRAKAWRLLHQYLASPEAMLATAMADDPRVTALHAQLLGWVLESGTHQADRIARH